jgi:hypothetical protein
MRSLSTSNTLQMLSAPLFTHNMWTTRCSHTPIMIVPQKGCE